MQIKLQVSILSLAVASIATATIIGQARAISTLRSQLAATQQAYYSTLNLNSELEAHLAVERTDDALHTQVTYALFRQVGELQLAQRILETSALRCNVKPNRAVVLAKLFYTVGEAQGVNPALLAAVGRHESCYNQKAKGQAKEVGMMQILPSTGRSLGFSEYDLQDVTVNVTAAAMLLASRPKEPIEHTLLAYNQGHARHTGNNYGNMVAATYRRML